MKVKRRAYSLWSQENRLLPASLIGWEKPHYSAEPSYIIPLSLCLSRENEGIGLLHAKTQATDDEEIDADEERL